MSQTPQLLPHSLLLQQHLPRTHLQPMPQASSASPPSRKHLRPKHTLPCLNRALLRDEFESGAGVLERAAVERSGQE